MKKYILILLLFSIPIRIYSQITIYNTEFYNYLESTSQNNEGTFSILEKIDYLINNPINLKTASINQILNIPCINYIDAYLIHNLFINNNIVTIDTITKYISINKEQLNILKLCSIISQNKTDTNNYFNALFQLRISKNSKTIQNYSPYLNTDDNFLLYNNYTFNYKEKYNAKITLNKKAGMKNILEFYSGFLEYNEGNLQLLLGDFEIKTGLGNICGGNSYFVKSSNIIEPTINYSNIISPFLSTNNNLILRGIATQYTFNLYKELNLTSMLWYSNTNHSNINKFNTDLILSENSIINNLFNEQFTGVSLILNSCSYSLGLNIAYFDYKKKNKDTNTTINIYPNYGFLNSFFAIYNIKKINVCGELTFDNNNNAGIKISSVYKDKNFDFVLNIRSYEDKFYSPFGINFGEFPNLSNEIGLYIGFIWKKDNTLQNYTYIDFFKSYSPTPLIDTIVKGLDIFNKLNIKIYLEISMLFFNYK